MLTAAVAVLSVRIITKRHVDNCISGCPQAADAAAGFANAAVRRGFMRKVLFIVLLQLIITAGVSLIFYYVQPLKVVPDQCNSDNTDNSAHLSCTC